MPQPTRPEPSSRSGPRSAGLPLGRFFGVPVFLSPSWLIIAAIITFSYSDLVRNNVDGIGQGGAYLLSFGFAVLFAVSLLAHELGHVAMCLLLDLKVRRVVIFLLGGVSEIEGEARRPREEYLVAIAGPLVTVLVAALTGAFSLLARPGSAVRLMLEILAWSNVLVAGFNLLPGLPLDGGKVLRAAVWQVSRSRLTGTRAAAWSGRGLALLVMALAVFTVPGRDVGLAVASLALAGLLATFIWVSASQSLTVATINSRLPELRIADLVRPTLDVPADLPVSEALRRAWESRSQGLVVVDSTGQPTAIVSEAQVMALPEQRRPWTTVAEVARPLEPGLRLADSATGEAVLDAVRATPASEYLVVGGDGRPVGVLATTDVATVLRRWGAAAAGVRR
ncbi:MAG TPA: site-2 protease family protein [Mycobacteriales bacterium]|nr:site-2 protease family protein [Mycobacteriales bacterium]